MADAFTRTVGVPVWLILVLCGLLLVQSHLMEKQLHILRDLFDGYRADRDALNTTPNDES